MSPERSYTPPAASLAKLEAMLARLGMDRVVLVQPGPYGADHACLCDALRLLGDRAVGIAQFPLQAPPDEATLIRLDECGIVGLRLTLWEQPEPDVGNLVLEAAARLSGSDWHVELQLRPEQALGLRPMLDRLTLTVVLDHFARASLRAAPEIGTLVRDNGVYVKLSAPYRLPDPQAAGHISKTLHELAPGRCVWGSDWPHTSSTPPGGDPGAPTPFHAVEVERLFGSVFSMLPSVDHARILCDTPQRLYGRRPARRHLAALKHRSDDRRHGCGIADPAASSGRQRS